MKEDRSVSLSVGSATSLLNVIYHPKDNLPLLAVVLLRKTSGATKLITVPSLYTIYCGQVLDQRQNCLGSYSGRSGY